MDNTTHLQNLNDRLYNLIKIMNRKLAAKEDVGLQVMLLEDLYEEMRQLLL